GAGGGRGWGWLRAAATAPNAAEAERTALPSKRVRGSAIAETDCDAAASPPSRSNHPQIPLIRDSYEHFRRGGMAEKRGGARRQAVCARLEHGDQAARGRLRELHAVGEQVERSAQRADHAGDLPLRADDAVSNYHRIILPDDLSEVSGRCEMMVQSSVGDQEYMAARDFAVDDTADVEARLADDVAAELDYDPRLRQRALCPFHYFPHAVADGGDIERLLAGKVRDA